MAFGQIPGFAWASAFWPNQQATPTSPPPKFPSHLTHTSGGWVNLGGGEENSVEFDFQTFWGKEGQNCSVPPAAHFSLPLKGGGGICLLLAPSRGTPKDGNTKQRFLLRSPKCGQAKTCRGGNERPRQPEQRTLPHWHLCHMQSVQWRALAGGSEQKLKKIHNRN